MSWWPSSFCSSKAFAPPSAAMVANVCRRSWMRKFSISATRPSHSDARFGTAHSSSEEGRCGPPAERFRVRAAQGDQPFSLHPFSCQAPAIHKKIPLPMLRRRGNFLIGRGGASFGACPLSAPTNLSPFCSLPHFLPVWELGHPSIHRLEVGVRDLVRSEYPDLICIIQHSNNNGPGHGFYLDGTLH